MRSLHLTLEQNSRVARSLAWITVSALHFDNRKCWPDSDISYNFRRENPRNKTIRATFEEITMAPTPDDPDKTADLGDDGGKICR